MEKLADQDLEHIYHHTKHLWDGINDRMFFITGGTGFFGKWLLSSFLYINKKKNLSNKAIVLTRDKKSFLSVNPQYICDDLLFVEGDIASFEFPKLPIHYIIHAATEANATLNTEQPLQMYSTIVEGTKRVLELAKQKKVKAILHTSSGAVYGEQPSEIKHIAENYNGAPDIFSIGSAYGEFKER